MRETAATPDHQTKEKSRPGATDRDQEVTPTEGYDMTSSITTKACEAWFLMEAADLRGLPTPFDVSVTDYATKLMLFTREDVTLWAEAIGSEVTEREVSGRIHWNATGELHEMAVSVACVSSVAAVA